MSEQQRIERAEAVMTAFVERTGVRSGEDPQRYLWTDAFAVCNLLGLARATGDARYRELALLLIDRVHHRLGRHRADDPRSGWLEGPAGAASEDHPTRAGLRIGKPLPERAPTERPSTRQEWDQDGQYFHYLTKWMHALDQTTRTTGEPVYNLWARELAHTAHQAFTYRSPGGGPMRMYWKMSIDLSRPLVPSMGHHDPLDGYVTTAQLRGTATELGDPDAAGGAGLAGDLAEELSDYAAMIRGGGFATDDPLGLGGLLLDAFRVEQLTRRGFEGEGLLVELLGEALTGMSSYLRQHDPTDPAERRLGFRELGLAIGLHAVEHMARAVERGVFAGGEAARTRVAELRPHGPVGAAIERFWLREDSRQASTWTEHRDINEVMLATSLTPEGLLVLPPVD